MQEISKELIKTRNELDQYKKIIIDFNDLTNQNKILRRLLPCVLLVIIYLIALFANFISPYKYDYENRLLPNDYIVIRNHGEGQGILGEGLGGVEDQQGHTSQEGGPNQLTSGLFLGSKSSLR